MIGIMDYGMGNIANVMSFLNRKGFKNILTKDVDVLEGCDMVLLPGVGAFGEAMQRLKDLGLDRFIKRWADSGRPVIGICLGMQLLFGSSSEHGTHEGLGILEGKVALFDGGQRIPHMGWNTLTDAEGNDVGDVYFVHSYRVEGADVSEVVHWCDYDGWFPATVRKGNVAGFQFHPEKSGAVGEWLLTTMIVELMENKNSRKNATDKEESR